jgi:ATP-dependent helicase HrpB
VTVFAPLAKQQLAAAGLLTESVEAVLDAEAGRVVAVQSTRYRDLPLRSARGGVVPPAAAAALLRPLLAASPWRWLGEQRDLRRLQARVQWLRARAPDCGLPALDDEAIGRAALDLLGERTDLRGLLDAPLAGQVLAAWTWEQRAALDRHAPDRLRLPSGRSALVDYAAAAGPTVRARLQEFFGLRSVAALAGGRVPVVLELLAPNQRPVQVTTDLESFWANVYPGVRRELQRRYPAHAWPEDPLRAIPEARPGRRRRGPAPD